MTISLSDIIDKYFLAETQNIPESTVKQCILRAMRTFCRRSKALRRILPCVYLPELHVAEIHVPSETEMEDCSWIEFHPENRRVFLRKCRVLNAVRGTIAIDKRQYVDDEPLDGMAMCSFMPKMDAANVDMDFFIRWLEPLRHGTLYELRSMLGREWYEPNVAMAHLEGFEDGIRQAVHEVQDEYRDSPAKAGTQWM